MNKLLKIMVMGLLIGSTLACQHSGSSNANGSTTDQSVIVVGAGIAGLRAAQQLSNAGVQVTVLEARSRIGGRLSSDRTIPNVTLDLGASWIHGTGGNPLYDYAQQQQVSMVAWDYDKAEVFNQDGTNNPILAQAEDTIEALFDSHFLSVFNQNSNASFQDVINAADNAGDLSHLSPQEINFIASSQIESEYAADVDQLSIQAVLEGEEFQDPEVVFPNGYDQLTTALAQGLDVRLEQVVSKIDYSTSKVVVVASGQEYRADKVLITVPLGVLKKGVIEFFPALPDAKQQAIDAFEMGVLNKVYLKFDHIFWSQASDNFGFVSQTKGDFSSWLNLAGVTHQPVLMAFNSGRYGIEIESLSDNEIVARAMAVLKAIYGEDIPNPTHHLITRWSQDPFSFGSYSYMAPAANNDMREDLAADIDKRIFFGGEATSSFYPATVHGAFISGDRESEKILRAR